MTGSIAPNRPGHHGTVVARTVGTVAISCNVVPIDPCAQWVYEADKVHRPMSNMSL